MPRRGREWALCGLLASYGPLSETTFILEGKIDIIKENFNANRDGESAMKSTKLCLFVLLSACQTSPAKKTSSNWTQLKTAQEVDCHPWPKKNEDLDVGSLERINWTKDQGIIAQGRSRNTRKVRYFVPFSGDHRIDADDLRKLEWPNDAVFLGQGPDEKDGGHTFVLLGTSDAGHRLELRGNQKSSALAQSNLKSSRTIGGGRTYAWRGGFWLGYYETGEDEAQDDQPLQVSSVVVRGRELVVQEVAGLSVVGRSMIFPRTDKLASIFWLNQGTSVRTEKSIFMFSEINQNSKTQKATSLKLPINHEVENWDLITENGKKFYLAFIDGDSLLGRATLKVAELTVTGPEVELNWVKSKPLTEEHVTRPLWLKKGKNLYVVLQKWKDEESTLATYQVDKGEVISRSAHGVFEEATKIQDIFHDQKSKATFALIKTSKGPMPKYFFCRFADF